MQSFRKSFNLLVVERNVPLNGMLGIMRRKAEMPSIFEGATAKMVPVGSTVSGVMGTKIIGWVSHRYVANKNLAN